MDVTIGGSIRLPSSLAYDRTQFGAWEEGTDTLTSDFRSIAETPFSVDKTMLIKTFFTSQWAVLITARRRYGKSDKYGHDKEFL